MAGSAGKVEVEKSKCYQRHVLLRLLNESITKIADKSEANTLFGFKACGILAMNQTKPRAYSENMVQYSFQPSQFNEN